MDNSSDSNYLQKNKGPFFAVLSSLCYGINNPMAGYAMQNGVPTIFSVVSRAIFMFLISLILAVSGKLKFNIPAEVRSHVIVMSIATALIN